MKKDDNYEEPCDSQEEARHFFERESIEKITIDRERVEDYE